MWNFLRDSAKSIWKPEEKAKLAQGLTGVLLEDWGGPRSLLALRYIHETVIPNLVYSFAKNSDLINNPTFSEIIAWKLRTQFAYPGTVVNKLSEDLLDVVKTMNLPQQNLDPREPWQRIFRLWVSDQSLLEIAEHTGYPLDYIELLFLRWKKVKKFVGYGRANLLECLGDLELREYGVEQLSFLYQFERASSTEPLFKQRLVLEQVILELGVNITVSDLVSLLEIVHDHEGHIDEVTLANSLQAVGSYKSLVKKQKQNTFALMLEGLLNLNVLQKSKSDGLCLSEKGAIILAPFLLPKFMGQIESAVATGNFERATQILTNLNSEILVNVLQDVVHKLSGDAAYTLLKSIFKQVNRRIDLYLLTLFGQFDSSFELLVGCLDDRDSLIRASACEALGQLGNNAASFRLIQQLHDPTAEVKQKAAYALGEIGSTASSKALTLIAEDLSESLNVRLQAREALRKLEARQLLRLKR